MSTSTQPINYQSLFLETIKSKYQYFLLGLTIFLILCILLVQIFPKNIVKTKSSTIKKINHNVIAQSKNKEISKQKKYIVKPGDFLWKIAQDYYGSGFNAYDIAKANNITNPNTIFTNQVLVLPSISPTSSPKIIAQGQIIATSTSRVTFTDTKYTIKDGDSLWDIAVKAYGDGYAWVKIAKANNIINPDIINVDNDLIIPRL